MANIDNAYTVERLSLDDKVLVVTHDSDPTTGGGYEAPIGSFLLRSDDSKTYIKFGENDTDWRQIDADADQFNEFLLTIKEPTGYPSRETSEISFNVGLRRFTIQPLAPATSFDYYIKGTKHVITTAKTVDVSNATNIYFIYFDEDEVLQCAALETVTLPSIYSDYAITSILYYNAAAGTAPYVADERHGVQMDGATHFYLHSSLGTQYMKGLAIDGTWLPDVVSPTNADVQLDVTPGTIRDEDICIHIYNTGGGINNSDLEQQLSPKAQIPILYRSGTTGIWNIKSADDFPLIYSGTAGYEDETDGLPPYNYWNGSTWSLTPVPANQYFLVHIFATNDINHPIVGIQGNEKYQNKPSGRDAAYQEITKLSGLPFEEFFPIASLIFEARTGYTNTPKVRARTTDDGDYYVDWRSTNNFPINITGGLTDHGNLAGLYDDDHTHYALAGSGSTRTFDIDDLINVDISVSPEPLTGETLVYDQGTSSWRNDNISAQYVEYDPSTSTLSSTTVQDAIDELAYAGSVISEPTGFPTRATSTLDFDDLTRTFSILPVSGSFEYYIKGEKFTIPGMRTVVVPNTEGTHYIYFDNTGTLRSTTTFTVDTILRNNAVVAAVYWCSVHSRAVYLGDERHGLVMDWSTHAYLHQIFGAQWLEGSNLFNFNIGNGTDPSHSQFAVGDGRIVDEDLYHIICNTGNGSNIYDLEQDLDPIAQIPIFWIDNVGRWHVKPADDFPIIYSGSGGGSPPVYVGVNGRLPYNNTTTGTLVEIGQGNYVLTHYFLTNSVLDPIIGIQGQQQYTNVDAARQGAESEIINLVVAGLPVEEFVALATVVWKSSTSNIDPPGGHIVQTNVAGGAAENYIDWRSSRITSALRGGLNDHGSLTGLYDDDHVQYALAGAGSTRTFNINDLYDVTITDLASGHLLVYNGSAWINQSPSASDKLIRISANDTTSGYLSEKLLAGAGMTLTLGNSGGNETLTINTAAQGVVVREEGTNISTERFRAMNFVGSLVTATDAGVVGGFQTANITIAPGLSIETIGGQSFLCLLDTSRGTGSPIIGKKLTVDNVTYMWSDTALSNNEWIDVGNSANATAGYIMPFNGTVVHASAHCVNNGNAVAKGIELYVDGTSTGNIVSIPAGTDVSTTNTTANVDFTAGAKLRLRASTTGGTISDTTVVLYIKWRA